MAGERRSRRLRAVRVRAYAKINLTLRVLGTRPDGYHELRTIFQSLALHDTLTFTAGAGPFHVECDDPACPVDRTNLVWRAAEFLWHGTGHRGRPRGSRVVIEKRIPLQAGLGGGSSDAAATLRALAVLWRAKLTEAALHRIAAEVGADVPFFLDGGTSLGVERGDVLFPLADWPASAVVLVVPNVGVSTAEAYEWFDKSYASFVARRLNGREGRRARTTPSASRDESPARHVPLSELRNDLQPPVVARHHEIDHLVRALGRRGASYAAMSGSGSAVFGLFGTRQTAEAAAKALAAPHLRIFVTRSITRREYRRLAAPETPVLQRVARA